MRGRRSVLALARAHLPHRPLPQRELASARQESSALTRELHELEERVKVQGERAVRSTQAPCCASPP